MEDQILNGEVRLNIELQGSDADPGSTRLTVKRVEPEDQLYFPETVEGLVAQVTPVTLHIPPKASCAITYKY